MDKASRQLLERDTFAFLLNKLFFYFLLLRLWDSIIILVHRTVIQHSYKLRFGLEELFFKRIISADSSWNALWQTQRTLGKTNRKSLKSGKSGVGFAVWGHFSSRREWRSKPFSTARSTHLSIKGKTGFWNYVQLQPAVRIHTVRTVHLR